MCMSSPDIPPPPTPTPVMPPEVSAAEDGTAKKDFVVDPKTGKKVMRRRGLRGLRIPAQRQGSTTPTT